MQNISKIKRQLFDLLKLSQIKSPNVDRVLYVDIDGHKNTEGGYDNDMYELQKEFGISFLGKFFSEVYFPLIHFINPNPQCNNVPKKLEIFSSNKSVDNHSNELYIQNYSNTEFVYEPDVHNYMSKVHDFLIEFHEYDTDCTMYENNNDAGNMHIRTWKNHISELINELHNAFIHGNLFTVAAMTRTLIECFVYYSIIVQSDDEQLIHHWYICNLCCLGKDNNELREIVRKYCQINHLDFNEMWNTYSKDPRNKRWLRQVIPNGQLDFEVYCKHLDDTQIYEDYQSACSFVHGQDLAAKTIPFTFYASICYRFDMMMLYIFRTIRLFPLNESLELQITDLEDELISLSEKYLQ